MDSEPYEMIEYDDENINSGTEDEQGIFIHNFFLKKPSKRSKDNI